MKYYLSVDRGEVIWAIQRMAQKNVDLLKKLGAVPQDQEIKIPSTLINSALETVMNSPAYAINGMDIIYFQGHWPEEYIPMVLNHEELHLLVYNLMIEDKIDPIGAGLWSQLLVDSQQCRQAISEVFGLNYNTVKDWTKTWLVNTLPPIRIIKGIFRRLKSAIQRIR